MNDDYEPSEDADAILDVLCDGRANPYLLRERTGLSKQRVNHALNRLGAAGWVSRVTRALYELPECTWCGTHVRPDDADEARYERAPVEADGGADPECATFELCSPCAREWDDLLSDERDAVFELRIDARVDL